MAGGSSAAAPTARRSGILQPGCRPANLPAQNLRHAVFLDDKRIAANSDRLHIWDTVSGTVTVIDGDHERMAFVAASPDRKQIALYGALHLWNALDNAPPAPVDAELGLLSSAAFSPDGRRLAVTSTAEIPASMDARSELACAPTG